MARLFDSVMPGAVDNAMENIHVELLKMTLDALLIFFLLQALCASVVILHTYKYNNTVLIQKQLHFNVSLGSRSSVTCEMCNRCSLYGYE